MVVRARVRGVYATALSKLLHDNGVELVDVSEVIAERLGIDTKRGLPADVTIKTDDSDSSQLLILGFPEAVNTVLRIIEDHIPYIIIYKPRIGLYSAFKAVVEGRKGNECIARTPIGKAVLVDVNSCSEGQEIPVSVVKVPIKSGERLVVSGRIRVVGRYAIVSYGSGVSFSSFIRNKDRITELLSASTKYLREGYSIRWRSNADEAPLDEVVSEIPHLIDRLNELKRKLIEAEPLDIVYEGEYVRLVELTYKSKEYLDKLRGTVTTTTPYHHMLRSCDVTISMVVDLLDSLAQYIDNAKLINVVRDWIVRRLQDKKEIVIYHKRPTGKTIILGKGVVEDAMVSSRGIEISIRRLVRGKGVYDGLNIPKEIGDIIHTKVVEGTWNIVHKYFNNEGSLKGTYININTPPEITPTGNVIYVDLGVDIVNDLEGCKLIDSSKFRELIENDLIGADIIAEVVKAIEDVLNSYCTV
ncbi:MAG: hypothetical protein DRO18_08040 [Thermoprotei archaeon]|nr:MAG: hypothetical protein DRO18_08040 [Thermoprotei archaeon]